MRKDKTMTKTEANNIWRDIPKKPMARNTAHRDYAVKITLNKAGGTRYAIRFGFINEAAEAFEGWEFIEFSDVEKLSDKIYFRLYHEKENVNVYTLSTCKFGDKYAKGRYATMTPNEKAEKIYRLKWVGKELSLKYDEECELYYIELDAEKGQNND